MTHPCRWIESHWKLSALCDVKIVWRRTGEQCMYKMTKGSVAIETEGFGGWRVSLALPIKHVKWNVRSMYKRTRRWMYQFQGCFVDIGDRLIAVVKCCVQVYKVKLAVPTVLLLFMVIPGETVAAERTGSRCIVGNTCPVQSFTCILSLWKSWGLLLSLEGIKLLFIKFHEYWK